MLAVVLAMGVLMLWQMIFPPAKEEPKKKEVPGQTAAPATPAETTQVGTTKEPGMAPSPMQRGPEQLIELSYQNVAVKFSSYGGVVKSWRLTDKRYSRDKTKGELVPQTKSETGAFAVNFAGSTFALPVQSEWKGTKVSDREVKYTIDTDKLSVEKTFKVVPEAYIITMSVKVIAKATAQQTLAVTVYGFQDPKDDGGGGQGIAPRVWSSSTLRGDEVYHTGVKAVQKKPRYELGFAWTGFEHPYLLVALAPKPTAVLGTTQEKGTYAEGNDGLMRTDILFYPSAPLAPNGPALEREIVGYFGPKHYSQLEAVDSIAGFSTGYHATMDLGWFAFIGRPLMWLLLKFYSFLGNWGLAIMLLTVLVKGATIPFTTKSMRSMKAMAVLAPEMKALQDKYKHDRQRLQMETMALYKQHGANPLSGCLPILLQMPIWLALYRMLSSTGELYLQPFIPGWIDDLTTNDPLYILPFVLLITMLVQARLTPMAPATDPTQRFQQRFMQWGLPIMFGVMAFFFPAGLTLYIFTNTILSALHSIWMNKFDKKSLAIAAKIKEQQEKKAAAVAEKDKPKPVIDTTATEGTKEAAPRANPNRPNQQRKKKRKR